MPITVVADLQLGDCGKGKIVDLLAEKADIVFRWNGGGNAGHHVINDLGEFKLHHVPVGILRGKPSVLGNGMVIGPEKLDREIEGLQDKGISVTPKTLLISDRAHIVMPWHLLEDAAVESVSGRGGVGSTKRGIAYAYADKMKRRGYRFADFLDRPTELMLPGIRDRMDHELKRIRFLYGDQLDYEGGIYGSALSCVNAVYRLLGYVARTEEVLRKALKDGARLLGEGAQGFHLDIDFGRYPFVSSSSASVGGIYQGAGIPPSEIPRVIGVAKAYTTYVGTGPFPTEITEEPGPTICEKGKEFGTTTGRRRRVGWFDTEMVRAAALQNACREMIVVKLDILSGVAPLKVAANYYYRGQCQIGVPSTAEKHEACTPLYSELPGWEYPLEEAGSLEQIEKNAPEAVDYARALGYLSGVKTIAISIGPHRNKTFFF